MVHAKSGQLPKISTLLRRKLVDTLCQRRQGKSGSWTHWTCAGCGFEYRGSGNSCLGLDKALFWWQSFKDRKYKRVPIRLILYL
jgi:hypothetical protein